MLCAGPRCSAPLSPLAEGCGLSGLGATGRLCSPAWLWRPGGGALSGLVSQGPAVEVCSLEASSSFSQCLGPAASRRGSGEARPSWCSRPPRWRGSPGLSHPSRCCLAPGWEPLLSEGFRAARLAPQLRVALQGAPPTRSPRIGAVLLPRAPQPRPSSCLHLLPPGSALRETASGSPLTFPC